jgi:cholesterol transport system auxiliary component
MAMRSILGGAAALLLAGCVSLGGGKVPPTLFTLTSAEAAPAGATASGTPSDALMVMEPETDRRLAVLRVPVQIDDAQVAYLQNAAWVERPARLFRALLAETLRARSGRLVLEDDQAATTPGVRLSGRLLDMGYDARSMAVVVRYDAIRTGAKGEVTTKRFEAEVSGVAAKPEAVGPALNRAANDVAAQVAEWMAGPAVDAAAVERRM